MSATGRALKGLARPDSGSLERLLFTEAMHLDRGDWEAWLAMYTEDCIYWVPAVPDQPDPHSHVSLFYEDRMMMRMRIDRLRQPNAFSQQPRTRTAHLVSNVLLESFDAATGDCSLRSTFHMLEYRRDEQRMFGGFCLHDLRQVNGEYLIARKRVELINCDAAHEVLQVFL